MPDRYTLPLRTAIASNTGGPYTHAWDRVIVPASGVVRGVWAGAVAITSNTITNSVDIYRQTDAPSAGSNTATSILQSPITLRNNRDNVAGVLNEPGSIVTAGDVLELRTYSKNTGSQPCFENLAATIEIERS